MVYVGATKSELETKRSFFESHLTTLNAIKLIDSAGKIDETARGRLFTEVFAVSPSYLGFTELGITIFDKSWNYPWKLSIFIPRFSPGTNAYEMPTYYEIGQAAGKKDPQLLYDKLQSGYRAKLQEIDLDLKKIRLNELHEKIEALDDLIQSEQGENDHTDQSKINQMASLVAEVTEIETLVKREDLI